MSNKAVVIEVTRGPVVESRHEGIAAVVKADGTVVASWGDIDAAILPRSANKPIQAMAFVESGAVERFGLGDEHIALSCASHNGEPRHVETVRRLAREDRPQRRRSRMRHACAQAATNGRGADPRQCRTDGRLQQLLGQAQRLPDHGRSLWRADQGLHHLRPSGAAPLARCHERPLRRRCPCLPAWHGRVRYSHARHAAQEPGAGDGQHGRPVAPVEQARGGGDTDPDRNERRALHGRGNRPVLHPQSTAIWRAWPR